jgi:hypothetical protein
MLSQPPVKVLTWLTLIEHGHSFPICALDEIVGINPDGEIKGVGVSIPSVTMGTKCEETMQSIMKKFAAQFPTVRAILAFSFRVDRQRLCPFLIELHADLTGDLILDVLLPHACHGENILRKIVEVALGAPPFRLVPEDLRPTAIRYTGNTHDIIQGDSIKKILEAIKKQSGEFIFTHLEMAKTL